jgi:hypothetical protein
MANINPKSLKNIFTEDVIKVLPTNANIKRGVANAINAQDPKWQEAHSKATSTDEYRQKVKEGHERFWATVDPSHREHIAKKAFDNQISFDSKEQAEEIFWKCWGEDRGEKLYKKLAKEYNVGFDGIVNLVRGAQGNGLHAWCPVDKETLKRNNKKFFFF